MGDAGKCNCYSCFTNSDFVNRPAQAWGRSLKKSQRLCRFTPSAKERSALNSSLLHPVDEFLPAVGPMNLANHLTTVFARQRAGHRGDRGVAAAPLGNRAGKRVLDHARFDEQLQASH